MRRLETNDWWAELTDLKDQLSLRELADRFDVTPGAISAALKRAGLSREAAPSGPRANRRARKAAAALPPEPGVPSPKRARASGGAWQVTVSGHHPWVVIAADLVEAAARASEVARERLGGEITGISYLGPLL